MIDSQRVVVGYARVFTQQSHACILVHTMSCMLIHKGRGFALQCFSYFYEYCNCNTRAMMGYKISLPLLVSVHVDKAPPAVLSLAFGSHVCSCNDCCYLDQYALTILLIQCCAIPILIMKHTFFSSAMFCMCLCFSFMYTCVVLSLLSVE